MQVPFLDLKRQYLRIQSEIDEAIRRVVASQFFILGPELTAFEEALAGFLGIKYAVGVASGTDALILALRALDIGPGDEVITTPFTFVATTLAITEVGATPVFVDIDPDTYQIDVNLIADKITSKTKAILPVHLYGAPSEIEKLAALAAKHNLFLVEDACQAHGAKVNNQMVGTFGQIGVFSFYPGKNLGAYGDGGALVTNDEKLRQKILYLRNYGQKQKYYHDESGRNSRLAEIQAAVLRVKLIHLLDWNQARARAVKIYQKKIVDLKMQKIPAGHESCYHLLVVESGRRNELQKYLSNNGVQTLIHYPVPVHLQKCFKGLNYSQGSFPVAERIASSVLSLPLFAELTDEEIEYVGDQINIFFKQ